MTGASLSKFQVRLLALLADTEDRPKGTDLSWQLREYYDRSISPSQLYPNLDELVDLGMVEKGNHDGRTNAYQLTDHGYETLESEVSWLTERISGERCE
jgi:DNA-binding PadR family transcriptional regulator